MGQTKAFRIVGVWGIGAVCLLPASLVWAAQAFQESGGQVVIEAEHYDSKVPRNSKDWSLATSQASYSGSGYLAALPNSGITQDTGYLTASPELIYNVTFATTGTYYVWVRGFGPTTADDSIHAGIDSTGPASADRISSFQAVWMWSRNTMDGVVASITVPTPGLHTIHLWMREDGFLVDKLTLTTNNAASFSGTGPTESARVTVTDTTPPTVTLTAPAAGSTITGTVTVSATASDNVGVIGVQFKLDGANLSAEDTTSPYSVSWSTPTVTNASHTLTAVARDAAGNSTTSAAVSVIVNNAPADSTPPTGTATINTGAAVTNTATVTLTLSATDNSGTVSQMQFSNDGVSWSAPEVYASSKVWTLSAGDGTKTVSAKFKDPSNNWSAATTDTIVLDTTAPTISGVSASGITTTTAAITWTTNEVATSQVDYGLTTAYGQTTALDAALVTAHTVNFSGLSAATLYHYRVRSKDAAGNERLGADATFTTALPPDTTPPTGTITIESGASATQHLTVTLTLSAADDRGAVAQMQFSNDGTIWSVPEAYTTTKTWTLTSGDGTKTVSVAFKDAAGNWSAPASDTIVLDTTPPVIGFTSPVDGAVIVAPSP